MNGKNNQISTKKDMEKDLSKELSRDDIDYIYSLIKGVCEREHKSYMKQQIEIHPNIQNPIEFQFSCPICGDSTKFEHKKRGHLYLNSMKYVCYNDREDDCSITTFFKRFNINLDIKVKKRIYDFMDFNIRYKNNNDYKLENLNLIIKFEDFLKAYNEKDFSELSNLKPIVQNSVQHKYLCKRYIYDYKNIYQAEYNIYRDEKFIKKVDVIVILNRNEEYVVGMQVRNLSDDKKYRFYKIYDFTKLYSFVYPDKVIDELEFMVYNKLSHFYNILNINWDRVVTVFEGYLDSIFCSNSIGMVGVENDNDLLFLLDNEDINIRFFLDFDKAGVKKSHTLIDKHPVFLWHKFFKSVLDKSNDKITVLNTFKQIKDLNKAVELNKNVDFFNKYKLEDYFSVNKFDKRFLKVL